MAGRVRAFSRADHFEKLGAEDLELLARSAYMVGNDDDYMADLERAHDLPGCSPSPTSRYRA